jgi:hypothetical protein
MLTSMLDKFPDLANDVTTGGAQSLHMCGMSPHNQHAARYLVEHDADIEALDTYGMTPLQRMASNNLATGARVLLEAGADFTNVGKCGRSPLHIARGSAANDVVEVLMPEEGATLPRGIVRIKIKRHQVDCHEERRCARGRWRVPSQESGGYPQGVCSRLRSPRLGHPVHVGEAEWRRSPCGHLVCSFHERLVHIPQQDRWQVVDRWTRR